MPFSVPTHLSNPLRRFARRLVPDAAPEVAAPLPMPESLAGEPWFSVGRAVEALGGERVDGWILEEWRGLALRARFSACWRDPRGNLWNVLPQAGAIAFLADPQRRYEGVPLADQYQALSRDVLLEDYLGLRRRWPAPAWTTRPASAWPGWPRAWKAGWPWAAVAIRLARAAAASATATAAPAWWPRPPERRCAVRRATARRVSACRRSPGPRLGCAAPPGAPWAGRPAVRR